MLNINIIDDTIPDLKLMLYKFLKIIKTAAIIFFVLLAVALLSLSVLDNKEFFIKNSFIQRIISHYDKDFIVETINPKIKFIDYKVIVSFDQIKIHKQNNKDIILSNCNITIKPLLLKSKINLQISNIPLNHFIQLDETPNVTVFIDNFFKHNHLICSGDVWLSFSLFTSDRAEIKLTSNDGWHDPKIANLNKLQLKQFNLNLFYTDDKISINQFNLSYLDNFQVSLSGSFSFDDDELLLADFKTDLAMFPIDYLAGFWHPQIFSGIQNWITKNVTHGIVKQAQGSFKFTDEDLDAPSLPKESIDVSMDLENFNVNYFVSYPPITQVKGNLKINGEGLYLNNASGLMVNSNLKNINLALPFENLVLNLKSDIEGDINSFKQFIPEDLNNIFNKFDIKYDSIKGRANAKLNLALPILEPFQANNLLLQIKATLKNVILDQKKIIKFADGELNIINDEDQIKFALLSKDIIAIQFESAHNLTKQDSNKTYLYAEVNSNNEAFVFNDKISLKGKIKTQFNTNNQNWQLNLNLDNAELLLIPLAHKKGNGEPFNLECSGQIEGDLVSSKVCDIIGQDFNLDGHFIYSMKNDLIQEMTLNEVKLGPNDFSFSTFLDKDIYYYNLRAKYLDLSNFSLDNFSFKEKSKFNYNLDLQIDKLLAPNKNQLKNIKAKIKTKSNKPIEIDFQAVDNDKKVTITKITRNDLTGYLLYADDVGTFAQDFNLYKNIKKGELWLEVFPKQDKEILSYYGTIKMSHFFLTNTSALTKIILGITSALNSPEALVRALQGGSLQSDSLDANFTYSDETILFNNGTIKGPSYEIKLKGYLNIKDRQLDFKGIYIPSFFGINKLISDIPVLGPLISGGKDSALIGANFSIKGDTKNPNLSFNPLSALTPGFLRDLF